MTTSSDVLPLTISLGHVGDDSLQLRFPPEYSEEILSLLDEHGIQHNTAAEFSEGPSDWTEVIEVLAVGFTSVGGLAGLAAVITAIAHRNDGKRLVIKKDGEEIEASGYSQRAVEEMLRDLPSKQAELDATVRKLSGISAAEDEGWPQ